MEGSMKGSMRGSMEASTPGGRFDGRFDEKFDGSFYPRCMRVGAANKEQVQALTKELAAFALEQHFLVPILNPHSQQQRPATAAANPFYSWPAFLLAPRMLQIVNDRDGGEELLRDLCDCVPNGPEITRSMRIRAILASGAHLTDLGAAG